MYKEKQKLFLLIPGNNNIGKKNYLKVYPENDNHYINLNFFPLTRVDHVANVMQRPM